MANTILTIIDGPNEGEFDAMVQFDDYSRMASFLTKEAKWCNLFCQSVCIDGPMMGKGNNVTASGDGWSVEYDTEKKTGIITLTKDIFTKEKEQVTA